MSTISFNGTGDMTEESSLKATWSTADWTTDTIKSGCSTFTGVYVESTLRIYGTLVPLCSREVLLKVTNALHFSDTWQRECSCVTPLCNHPDNLPPFDTHNATHNGNPPDDDKGESAHGGTDLTPYQFQAGSLKVSVPRVLL